MTKNFSTLYNSVLKEMNQAPPQQPAAATQQPTQQPAQQPAAAVDPKQLAATITKIQDPELLAAIQKLLATKPTTPAAQPQAAQTPAPNAAQQPKTA
jgi:hypothetical protein